MGENLRRNVPQVGYDPTKPPVEYKFPEDEPSFWLPGQNTKYPDTYMEPDSSKIENKVPLAVPITIRGLVGWNQNYAPSSVFRTIYLGHRDYVDCRVFYVSEETYGAGTYRGTADRTMVENKAFAEATNIASTYSANKTTEQLLDPYIYKELHLTATRDENGVANSYPEGEYTKIYAGSLQDGNYEYIAGGGVPATMYGRKHKMNTGGFVGADGDIPAGGPYDNAITAYLYAGQDDAGNDATSPSYKGNESAHLGPYYNQVLRVPSMRGTLYYFLRNIISGMTQTNILSIVPYTPDLTPSSPGWTTLVNGAFSGLGALKAITGLTLQP